MIFDLLSNPFFGLVQILGIVVSLTIHEYAHAKAADSLGDPTPQLQGRLTLNPAAHIDPIGMILILFTGFGWGRPVQYDPYNLQDPRRDGMKIAFAGPAINIFLALSLSICIKVLLLLQLTSTSGALYDIATILIAQNLGLAIFNLIPVEPLDGFKIVGGLLPAEQAHQWFELRRYGLLFLIILMMPMGGSSIVGQIVSPLVRLGLSFLL